MKPMRSEHGYTLVEIMIAMALMSVGVAATLRVFGSSGRTAQAAQRDNVATQKAQAALDLLSTTPYNQLGLTSTPASSTDQLDPGYRVSGTTLAVKPGLTETFVLSTDAGQSGAAVDPHPEPFTVGSGTSAISGNIYRYITWRDEDCPTGICDGAQNTKRLTVAITIDPHGAVAAGTPIWVSKVVPDPQALPPGATGGTPTGSTVSAQDFYLYDARCGNTTRQAPNASHPTHNTAQTSTSAAATSYCENSNTALQPDLMGVDLPSEDPATTPLYQLSSDLSGTYDGGLAMMRHDTGCRTTYPEENATDPNATDQWSIHGWATNTFASTFTLTGQVTLSLYTAAVGGVSGAGVMCATLIDRSVSGGVPVDVNLGSFTYSLSSWPTTVRRISFTLNLPAADIAAGHRLVLVLGVKASSANDLYFVYDHPRYPSFMEVATPTPL